MSCCAVSCSSRTTKEGVKDPELSFHIFPKCPEIRCEWIKAIRRDNWEPSKYSRLCSKHFEQSCYVTGLSIKRLKSDAVPTVFEEYPVYDQTKAVASKYMMKPCHLQVCRICFATECKLYPMTLDKKLDEAYKLLTGLTMKSEDSLPPYLCTECACRLLNCIRFRAKSLRAHLVLLEAANKHSTVTLETIQSISGEQIGSNLMVTHYEVDHYDLIIDHDTIKQEDTDMESTIDEINAEIDDDTSNHLSDDNMVSLSHMVDYDAECDIQDEDIESDSEVPQEFDEADDIQYNVINEEVEVEDTNISTDDQVDRFSTEEISAIENIESNVNQGCSSEENVIDGNVAPPKMVRQNYAVLRETLRQKKKVSVVTGNPMKYVHLYVPRNLTRVNCLETSSDDMACGKAYSVGT